MKKLFEYSNSTWVRYSAYEWKKGPDGVLYLTACQRAMPKICDPMENYQQMVLDAITIGRMGMAKREDAEIQEAIQEFVTNYGLLGFLTALPTTPKFMDYEAVYLPKNHFIKKEVMSTKDYLALFFPFEKLDLHKRGTSTVWSVEGDPTMQALMLAMGDLPLAENLSMMRQYAERYDWLKQQFMDWCFLYTTCYFYYEDGATLPFDAKRLIWESTKAFGGNASFYHVELRERPTMVWDFHSLLLCVQMMLCHMLTDEKQYIRMCVQCSRAFLSTRPNALYCSPECKRQHYAQKRKLDGK